MPSPQNRIIDGPAGPLEARLLPGASRESADPSAPQAVLCHPHPLYGGSMDDAVLDALARPLHQSGHDVWRFNFRGVGGSAGSHDGQGGEADDVSAVLAAVQADRDGGSAPLLAGYSFGAAMAWQAASKDRISELWLIAPPLGVMAFEARLLAVPLQLWLGGADSYCAEDDARAFARTAGAAPARAVTVLPEAGHFFAGALDALSDCAAARLGARENQ
jgi:alpha/beta superfamily hydrolase